MHKVSTIYIEVNVVKLFGAGTLRWIVWNYNLEILKQSGKFGAALVLESRCPFMGPNSQCITIDFFLHLCSSLCFWLWLYYLDAVIKFLMMIDIPCNHQRAWEIICEKTWSWTKTRLHLENGLFNSWIAQGCKIIICRKRRCQFMT